MSEQATKSMNQQLQDSVELLNANLRKTAERLRHVEAQCKQAAHKLTQTEKSH